MHPSSLVSVAHSHAHALSQLTHLDLFQTSFLDIAEDLRYLDFRRLRPINLTLVKSITSVLGTLPLLVAHRAELEQAQFLSALRGLDRLESCCWAALYTDTLYRTLPAEVSLKSEARRLLGVRGRLTDELCILGLRGVNVERVIERRLDTSYRHLPTSVRLLTKFLRGHLEDSGLSLLTAEDLDAAEQLAATFRAAHLARRSGSGVTKKQEVALLRRGTFTLFVNAYDEVRRALQKIQPDLADRIAPSLYRRDRRASRPKRRAPAPSPPSLSLRSSASSSPSTRFSKVGPFS